MTKTTGHRNHLDDLRGASRLAIDAVKGVTDLVEAMHRTIGGGPAVLGRPLAGATRLFTAPVYKSIRAVTDLVGAGIDVPLSRLAPLLADGAAGPEREAVRAALNGVLGDYLAETKNPLAIEMRWANATEMQESESTSKAPIEKSAAVGKKLLVLLHGSSMNAAQWTRRGHNHGAALARDLEFSPLYLEYNSGLHVSRNGRDLDDLLERTLVESKDPIESITLLGFSMGGLVARSACHQAELSGHAWRKKLRALVCLGTPHHGAPLERGGSWVDVLLRVSRYSAPLAVLGQIRSAGVTDMRFGNVLDEHWEGRDRFEFAGDNRTPLPLPEGVECFAIAATTGSGPRAGLPSDGLVPVASALGKNQDEKLTLAFPETHQKIIPKTSHLDLLDRPEAFTTLKTFLAPR